MPEFLVSVCLFRSNMADQGSQLTEGFALQPFVEKASKLSGDALAKVVSEALAHPLVYVFQELLDLPNVQEACLTNIYDNSLANTCL